MGTSAKTWKFYKNWQSSHKNKCIGFKDKCIEKQLDHILIQRYLPSETMVKYWIYSFGAGYLILDKKKGD